MKKAIPALFAAMALSAPCVAPAAQGDGVALEPATAKLAQDAFAVNVFRGLVAEQTGNVVFSPASMEGLLALLEKGARGATLQAIESLPAGQRGVKSAMNVESADALFVADDLKLKPVAVEDIRTVAFSQPPAAVQAINDWCDSKTHGLIPKLVTTNDITAKTRMVALNAVYLKEKWLNPFDKAATNENGKFLAKGGERVTVPMMRQTKRFRYAEGDDWKAVALDYDSNGREGAPGYFIGVLPKGDAREFAAGLTPEKYHAIRQALADAPYDKTAVSLPKMNVETPAFSLNRVLCANGLAPLFRGADFSGFADEPLVVTSVIQRCRVIVDEEKTEAAAVTGAIMCRMAARPEPEPHVINFDRPFIWAIDDLSTGAAPYFIGLFEKP